MASFLKFFAASALAVLALTQPVSPAAAAEPVTIGSIEALSGPASRYGLAIRNGLELALDEVNAAGGVLSGRPLRILFEDSAGQKEQAINAARKLIGRDK
ncbi:MAG: ABC transporter substrate-binding protein, partial [Rhodospirillaceae bacterium]